MSEQNNKEVGEVHIYACGGAGTNIASHFEAFRGKSKVGFANIRITYIDTSLSNLRSKNIDPANIFKIESLDGESIDGSGKDRGENNVPAKERINEILQKHPPEGTFPIVIGSGGGGSGGVIAPYLVAELLARGLPAVSILVGSTTSKKDALNTQKTLQSYAGVAKKAGIPIAMHYLPNEKGVPLSKVDSAARDVISSLTCLASRQNEELDTMDVRNWLSPHKLDTFKDTWLLSLNIVTAESKNLKELGHVMSVATLVTGPDQDPSFPDQSVTPDIQFKGIVPKDMTIGLTPVFFVISDGLIFNEHKRIDKVLQELRKASDSRVVSGNIASNNSDDDGVVI